jgi:uncharacterized protein
VLSPLEVLGILAAGFAAGGINTIVGSGSLITFPTLLAFGFPPVVANVSNTVGLALGAGSGVVGYRRELKGQLRRCLTFGTATTIGALIGGVLLLTLPSSVFAAVVPALILLACGLIAVQPMLVGRLTREHGHGLSVIGLAGVLLTGVYGGYFGAAQGVILIALLGIVLDDHMQRINALKNVLAGLANVVAALLFISVTHIAWAAAGLLAVSSIVGAQVGAHYGRRIPPQVLRWTIVGVGTSVAIVLFLRG